MQSYYFVELCAEGKTGGFNNPTQAILDILSFWAKKQHFWLKNKNKKEKKMLYGCPCTSCSAYGNTCNLCCILCWGMSDKSILCKHLR